MQKKKEAVKPAMVKVNKKIHSRVSKRVAGTSKTIGEFYDEAAIEKLKNKSCNISA